MKGLVPILGTGNSLHPLIIIMQCNQCKTKKTREHCVACTFILTANSCEDHNQMTSFKLNNSTGNILLSKLF